MTSMGRAKIVLAVVVLAAVGVVVAAYLHERDEEALSKDANAVADASADASAKVAKGKPAPKKKGGRAAKTRVTTRPPPVAHAPSPQTAAGPSPAPPNHVGPDDGDPSDPGAAPAPAPAPHHRHYGPPSGASYESAIGGNNAHITMGASAGPDLTDAQVSAPMGDGSFIDECGAPEDMGITVKVAIKMGRAFGVSVSTSPRSTNVANCIDHHVRSLSWPQSPKMDSFVTTY